MGRQCKGDEPHETLVHLDVCIETVWMMLRYRQVDRIGWQMPLVSWEWAACS